MLSLLATGTTSSRLGSPRVLFEGDADLVSACTVGDRVVALQESGLGHARRLLLLPREGGRVVRSKVADRVESVACVGGVRFARTLGGWHRVDVRTLKITPETRTSFRFGGRPSPPLGTKLAPSTDGTVLLRGSKARTTVHFVDLARALRHLDPWSPEVRLMGVSSHRFVVGNAGALVGVDARGRIRPLWAATDGHARFFDVEPDRILLADRSNRLLELRAPDDRP